MDDSGVCRDVCPGTSSGGSRCGRPSAAARSIAPPFSSPNCAAHADDGAARCLRGRRAGVEGGGGARAAALEADLGVDRFQVPQQPGQDRHEEKESEACRLDDDPRKPDHGHGVARGQPFEEAGLERPVRCDPHRFLCRSLPANRLSIHQHHENLFPGVFANHDLHLEPSRGDGPNLGPAARPRQGRRPPGRARSPNPVEPPVRDAACRLRENQTHPARDQAALTRTHDPFDPRSGGSMVVIRRHPFRGGRCLSCASPKTRA